MLTARSPITARLDAIPEIMPVLAADSKGMSAKNYPLTKLRHEIVCSKIDYIIPFLDSILESRNGY